MYMSSGSHFPHFLLKSINAHHILNAILCPGSYIHAAHYFPVTWQAQKRVTSTSVPVHTMNSIWTVS